MPGANLTRIEAEERKSIIAAPIHYTVKLDLTRGAKDFGSETTITFDAKPGESSFLDLIANEVSEITLNGETLDPAEAYVDSRIELKGLKEHNEVTVKAMCQYSNTGEGLHRSVDPSDGNVYLYTQFEVPDARRVYAVFDQPDLKAVFDFSVLAAKSWIVTSNMPTSSVTDNETVTEEGTLGDHAAETTKLWVFELTPTMSSYLTAICAGPYAEWHTEYANEDGRTVPMAMYCRQALAKAFSKDVDYLFDITKKGFAFYAKTWGVPYPYAKFDQIYVPEYNAGAMENIGMVTIRDQYVFESKVTDAYAERRVVTVLHELAHMWFGDYVTMKWWNDLWLNESFAEFTSTLATAEATEWKDAWATFSSGEKSWALNQDQLSTTHPIVAPINDLNDTYVNFDGITYAKGASVLKQLAFYVGRTQFFEGIHNYLNRHAYSNATLADLLIELEKEKRRGTPIPSRVNVGLMIEVPSIVFQLEDVLKQADFISIGTNDLAQFTFACDRGNPRLTERYDVLSSPFLKLMGDIVAKADAAGVYCSVCGEMASNPIEAMALIGLGYRNLSASGSSYGRVKSMIRSVNAAEVSDYVKSLLKSQKRTLRPQLMAYAYDHGIEIY